MWVFAILLYFGGGPAPAISTPTSNLAESGLLFSGNPNSSKPIDLLVWIYKDGKLVKSALQLYFDESTRKIPYPLSPGVYSLIFRTGNMTGNIAQAARIERGFTVIRITRLFAAPQSPSMQMPAAQAPSKSMPIAQTPSKSMPVPVAPSKSMPVPVAPSGLLSMPMVPSKSLPPSVIRIEVENPESEAPPPPPVDAPAPPAAAPVVSS